MRNTLGGGGASVVQENFRHHQSRAPEISGTLGSVGRKARDILSQIDCALLSFVFVNTDGLNRQVLGNSEKSHAAPCVESFARCSINLSRPAEVPWEDFLVCASKP